MCDVRNHYRNTSFGVQDIKIESNKGEKLTIEITCGKDY